MKLPQFPPGVTLPSSLPINASMMYAKNLTTLFNTLYLKPEEGVNWNDEIAKGACITRDGEIVNATVKGIVGG